MWPLTGVTRAVSDGTQRYAAKSAARPTATATAAAGAGAGAAGAAGAAFPGPAGHGPTAGIRQERCQGRTGTTVRAQADLEMVVKRAEWFSNATGEQQAQESN